MNFIMKFIGLVLFGTFMYYCGEATSKRTVHLNIEQKLLEKMIESPVEDEFGFGYIFGLTQCSSIVHKMTVGEYE